MHQDDSGPGPRGKDDLMYIVSPLLDAHCSTLLRSLHIHNHLDEGLALFNLPVFPFCLSLLC